MRIAGILLILLGLGIFGYWGLTGAHFVTQYQVPETTTAIDDFGDEVTTTTLVDRFQFGLMPDRGPDGALPLGGGAIGLGVLLLGAGVIRKKKPRSSAA